MHISSLIFCQPSDHQFRGAGIIPSHVLWHTWHSIAADPKSQHTIQSTAAKHNSLPRTFVTHFKATDPTQPSNIQEIEKTDSKTPKADKTQTDFAALKFCELDILNRVWLGK